ncbi:hypothetical protein JHK82_044885 [Glycine max]|nr:hypothetical protein JHK82_044885 [Glycine max]
MVQIICRHHDICVSVFPVTASPHSLSFTLSIFREKIEPPDETSIFSLGSDGKSIKGGGHPHPSNIGDLFSEGSLNPYAEDPYAFD